MGGPNTAKGTEVDNTKALMGPRIVLETSSPIATEKESCPAAASPLIVFVPLVLMLDSG